MKVIFAACHFATLCVLLMYLLMTLFSICGCKTNEPDLSTSNYQDSIAQNFIVTNGMPITEESMAEMGATLPDVDVVLDKLSNTDSFVDFQNMDDLLLSRCLNILSSSVVSKRLFLIRSKLIYLFCYSKQPSEYKMKFQLYAMHAAIKSPFYYKSLLCMGRGGCVGLRDKELLLWMVILVSKPYSDSYDPEYDIAKEFVSIEEIKSRVKSIDYKRADIAQAGYSLDIVLKYIDSIEAAIKSS